MDTYRRPVSPAELLEMREVIAELKVRVAHAEEALKHCVTRGEFAAIKWVVVLLVGTALTYVVTQVLARLAH